jgi:hypothetical protein
MVESAGNDLFSIFQKYTKGAEMDGKTFAKFCKDTKLVDKKLTGTDVDLIFASIKEVRTISFDQFKKGIEKCATKKGKTYDDCVTIICGSGGPQFKGTQADYVKFHDDKSLYTGVYANGGPSTVDIGSGGKISDLSQLADRSGADVRGVKK